MLYYYANIIWVKKKGYDYYEPIYLKGGKLIKDRNQEKDRHDPHR